MAGQEALEAVNLGGAAPRRSLQRRVASTMLATFASLMILLGGAVFGWRITSRLAELDQQVEWLTTAVRQDLELSVHAKHRNIDAAYARIDWLRGLGDELVHAIVFAPAGTAVTGVDADGQLDSRWLLGRRTDDVSDISWYERSVLVEVRPAAEIAGNAPLAGAAAALDDFDLDAALALDEAALAVDEATGDDTAPAAEAERRSAVRLTLSALPAAKGEAFYVLFAGLLVGLVGLIAIRRNLREVIMLLGPAFAQAQQMRDGDFTARSEAEYDELGVLVDAFNDIGDSLSGMVGDVRQLAGEVSATVERVQAESSAIQLGVERELSAISDTEGAVRVMRTSLEESSEGLGALVGRADASTSDTARIASANEQTGTAVGGLRETATRQQQSLFVLEQRADALARSAEVLSTSTSSARDVSVEVLTRLQAASERAEEAVSMAGNAQSEAAAGGAAIESAVASISDIAERTSHMQGSLGMLVERVGQMQPVLGAIDDVTASTQLLALNANILAAQAGEHGRPFQVVVEQLKALSRRTQALTNEANAAVEDVLEQRGKTAAAGDRLAEVVQHSLEDARRAGGALQRITEGVGTSHQVSQTIALSVSDQQASLREALVSIEHAAVAGGEVESAARSVVQECGVLGDVGSQIDDVAVSVVSATEAQGALTERVGGTLREVSGQVKALAKSQAHQDEDMERVLITMTQIRMVAEDARGRAEALGTVVEGLRHSADRLFDGIARFRTTERAVAPRDEPRDELSL